MLEIDGRGVARRRVNRCEYAVRPDGEGGAVGGPRPPGGTSRLRHISQYVQDLAALKVYLTVILGVVVMGALPRKGGVLCSFAGGPVVVVATSEALDVGKANQSIEEDKSIGDHGCSVSGVGGGLGAAVDGEEVPFLQELGGAVERDRGEHFGGMRGGYSAGTAGIVAYHLAHLTDEVLQEAEKEPQDHRGDEWHVVDIM